MAVKFPCSGSAIKRFEDPDFLRLTETGTLIIDFDDEAGSDLLSDTLARRPYRTSPSNPRGCSRPIEVSTCRFPPSRKATRMRVEFGRRTEEPELTATESRSLARWAAISSRSSA